MNRQILFGATRRLKNDIITSTSWEDLRIEGKLVINEITKAIDASDAAVFDLTDLNHNVLFELGYAVARDKPVTVLLEGADVDAVSTFRRLSLLSSVGYSTWVNEDSIVGRAMQGAFSGASESLSDELIRAARPSVESSLFFMPAYVQSEPDRRLRNLVQRLVDGGVPMAIADPEEAKLEPLAWYYSKVYAAAACVFHLEAPRRSGADLHNARLSLVAGIAHGLGRPLLMIADESLSVPLDYRDLLKVYRDADEAETTTGRWIDNLALVPPAPAPRRKLSVELASLTFGEHVAENEVKELPNYFVETSAFRDVLHSHLAVFVGRKGTGKSANFFEACNRLSADRDTLTVPIRPAAYDFEGITAALLPMSRYVQQRTVEGIWKFLLYTEIARVVAVDIARATVNTPPSRTQQDFLDGLESAPFDVRTDFATRVSDLLLALGRATEFDLSADSGRVEINEAIHNEWLARLCRLLIPVLAGRQKIAILIDNLDKGWERSQDLAVLSELLLGLMSCAGRVERDLLPAPTDSTLSMTLFLRSDIFAYMREHAREPDKIVSNFVRWDDPKVLIRVVEERFLWGRPDGTDPGELWRKYFCPVVRGMKTQDYLTNRVLPRPRDLIFLCNGAVSVAMDRRHDTVEEEDLIAAERNYSQFAFEALLVENGITIAELEAVLFEFTASDAILNRREVEELIARAGLTDVKVEQVIQRLKAISFLGLETRRDEFVFSDGGRELEKSEVLARKLEGTAGNVRYCIHPAFRPYLEIDDPAL